MKGRNKIIAEDLLPTTSKSDIEGKVVNLHLHGIPELTELKDRQEKLLNNKTFISKLPDKGAKLQAFLDKIIKEIKQKQEEVNACDLLQNLKLSGVDKQSVQNVEWDGKFESRKNTYLDSDDDSEPEDVLHILSQNTAVEKNVKIIQPIKPLITNENLLEIGELPHVKYIVEKTEHNSVTKIAGNFKPFKTTKSDVHDPQKEILRKKHNHWEVTAATPPPIINGPAKILNLEESLKLQKEYNVHLKEVESKHAAERLLLRAGVRLAAMPENPALLGAYREIESDVSDTEGSDREVHDEEPERGGVVFTVLK